MYSCACEQTEENVNMLFVMSAMRNVQKHRRDLRVASSVKMSWSSLVTMSYAICRFVLTCGDVPGIIWEVRSGLIVRKVVLSVRGCLMWGIKWMRMFCVKKICRFLFPVESAADWASLAHGQTVEDGKWTFVSYDFADCGRCSFVLVDCVCGWTYFDSARHILSEI